MRIWSIHPKYLDSKGLVALWREALLAKKVLMGNTKGYKNHPQLDRFKTSKNPVEFIDKYLSGVYYEACNRGFKFNKEKINWNFDNGKLKVTDGQMNFELKHLLIKLKQRQKDKFEEIIDVIELDPHPLFLVVKGNIEKWEINKIGH